MQCSVSHLIWSFLSARTPYPSNQKQRGQANELLFRSANLRQCKSAINQQIQLQCTPMHLLYVHPLQSITTQLRANIVMRH